MPAETSDSGQTQSDTFVATVAPSSVRAAPELGCIVHEIGVGDPEPIRHDGIRRVDWVAAQRDRGSPDPRAPGHADCADVVLTLLSVPARSASVRKFSVGHHRQWSNRVLSQLKLLP